MDRQNPDLTKWTSRPGVLHHAFHEDSGPSTEADRGREPVLRKERGGPGRSIDLLHGIDCPEATKHAYVN